jgi:ribosomal protein L44E
MSKSQPTSTERIEYCASCGTHSPHEVSIELKTESAKETNRAFSREPYRVTKCRSCGDERAQRMNNA